MMMTRLSQAMRQSSDPRVTGHPSKNAGFAFIEVAIASMVISLLVLSFIYVLQLTQKGTLSTKWRGQAIQVARDQMELIKADIMATAWEEIGVDTPFDYDYYEPVTVKLARGNIEFIVDATVRYVEIDGYDAEADPDSSDYEKDPLVIPPNPGVNPTPEPADYRYADPNPNTYTSHHVVYVPTPDATPGAAQISDIVLVRVDVYWKESRPRKADIKTARHRFEGYQNIHLESLVSNRKITPSSGNLEVFVYKTGGTPPAIGGANVYLIDALTTKAMDLQKSDAQGRVLFENVSPGLYFVISKNNDAIQFGSDTNGPTAQPAGGYVVDHDMTAGGDDSPGGDRLLLEPLAGWDVQGRVWGWIVQPDLTAVLTPIPGAIVSVNDQFSDPVMTSDDSGGPNEVGYYYFHLSNNNQVEPGTHDFKAQVYDDTKLFETQIPDDPAGPDRMIGLTNVHPTSGATAVPIFVDTASSLLRDDPTMALTMLAPYELTTYTFEIVDKDGVCLDGTDFRPIVVTVSDGGSGAPFTNVFNLTSTSDCLVTVKLVNPGVYLTTVTIPDSGVKDWIPYVGDIRYQLSPTPISIAMGLAPDKFPFMPAVAKLIGSVDGLEVSFDYSEFQVGLYETTTEDLLYAFPLNADGTIDIDQIPVFPTGPRDFDIKLIMDSAYTSVPAEFPVYSFTRGVEADLGGSPSFTVYRGVGYVSGTVKNSHNNIISTGVVVMAVINGATPPTELSHNVANVYIATTGEDGKFKLLVPTAVGGTDYDIHVYHTPRKVSTNGTMSYQPTLIESTSMVTIDSDDTLQNPYVLDITVSGVLVGYE